MSKVAAYWHFKALRQAADLGEARIVLADSLLSLLVAVLSPTEFDLMRQRLNRLPEPPARPKLTKTDWLAAGGVFSACFSVYISGRDSVPLRWRNAMVALRISNAIAILLLIYHWLCLGALCWTSPLVDGTHNGHPWVRFGRHHHRLGRMKINTSLPRSTHPSCTSHRLWAGASPHQPGTQAGDFEIYGLYGLLGRSPSLRMALNVPHSEFFVSLTMTAVRNGNFFCIWPQLTRSSLD